LRILYFLSWETWLKHGMCSFYMKEGWIKIPFYVYNSFNNYLVMWTSNIYNVLKFNSW